MPVEDHGADYSLKICLVGEGGVGKTSLVRRYVFNQFSDSYIKTMGTKISKKNVIIDHPSKGKQRVTLLVWDIMGQQGFRQMLQQAYFYGAQGIVAVCDVTRMETLEELSGWIESVGTVVGEIPIVFMGNKSDLDDQLVATADDLKSFAGTYESSHTFMSSAKTGENVENAFRALGHEILDKGIKSAPRAV